MSNPYGQQPYGQQPYGQQPYGQNPYQLGEVPLSAPLYGATIKQAFVRFFKKYGTFSGRASRSEFWWWYLASYVIGLVLSFAGRPFAGPQPVPPAGADQAEAYRYFTDVMTWSVQGSVLSIIWSLLTFVGFLALSSRRLHDTNRSAWWILIGLVPLVGTIILVVFYASGPRPEGQRFDR